MREEIAATHGDVFWTDLAAHAQRDALIVVAPGIDLLDAAEALAKNEAAAVDAWIRSGQLRKPSAEELTRWPLETAAIFESVIVAPFVLIRARRRASAAN